MAAMLTADPRFTPIQARVAGQHLELCRRSHRVISLVNLGAEEAGAEGGKQPGGWQRWLCCEARPFDLAGTCRDDRAGLGWKAWVPWEE